MFLGSILEYFLLFQGIFVKVETLYIRSMAIVEQGRSSAHPLVTKNLDNVAYMTRLQIKLDIIFLTLFSEVASHRGSQGCWLISLLTSDRLDSECSLSMTTVLFFTFVFFSRVSTISWVQFTAVLWPSRRKSWALITRTWLQFLPVWRIC